MSKQTLGDLLIENNNIDSSELELFNYGLRVAKLLFANLFTAILISYFMGTTLYCILFLLVFSPLRRYSGGFHAKSPVICFVESQVLIVSAQLFAINFNDNIGFLHEIILLLSCIAGIIIYFKSPVYSRYKPLTPAQEKSYGKLAKILTVLYILLSFLLFIMDKRVIFLLISIALILQSCLLFIPEQEHTK